MKVIVYCASEGSQSDVSGLTLKCTPSERRVWVENGKGAGGRKIAFSSTFDGVVDGSTAEGAAQALYDEGFAKAVEAVTADKVGCVLCVGSGAGKRGALLGATCDQALAKLLQAADEKGLELSIAAVHVLWERLTDLLDGAAIEPGNARRKTRFVQLAGNTFRASQGPGHTRRGVPGRAPRASPCAPPPGSPWTAHRHRRRRTCRRRRHRCLSWRRPSPP